MSTVDDNDMHPNDPWSEEEEEVDVWWEGDYWITEDRIEEQDDKLVDGEDESKHPDSNKNEEIKSYNELPSDCKGFESCVSIERLLTCLKHYSAFKLKNNENDRRIFINYANEVYKHQLLIEDFDHFQRDHDKELYEIMNYAIENEPSSKCDIESCDYASRHYRAPNINENMSIQLDPALKLYGDTVDSFHFYLLHLHELGLRRIKKDETKTDNDDTNNDDSYDSEFAEIADVISNARSSTNRFSRLSSSNKFNIKTGGAIKIKSDQPENLVSDNVTYLDVLIEHLHEMKIEKDAILRLINYLKKEQYDTETLDLDLRMMAQESNVSQHMVDSEKCMEAVNKMLGKSRGMVLWFYLCIMK